MLSQVSSQWLPWLYWTIWLTLLVTSIALFWLGRRKLALIGLILVFLLGALAFIPVID